MDPQHTDILVIGAGISGIRSALDLALMDYRVTLVDKAPFAGGTLIQLDHQFPSDRCGICRMLPMAERNDLMQYCPRLGLIHEHIDVHLSTELVGLSGEPGAFKAVLRQKPTPVDPERCIGCGECVSVCPVEVPDTYNAGLTQRKAIFLPIPYGLPDSYGVDMEACTLCGECERVCPTEAIDITKGFQETQLTTAAVILAPGFGSFDPADKKNLFCYDHPNVLTSIEFERLISATGPGKGQLLRPGDHKAVRKAAWFQCVGSRDHQVNADFCSSACCMYSIKEAMLAKEQTGGQLEATIYYMDMRTFGKDFQRYRDRAEKDGGIRFVRSRVHSVVPEGENGDLCFYYADDHGEMKKTVVDMIVLATGQRPPEGTRALLEITRARSNPWGFVQHAPFSPARIGREGIFSSGSFSCLRDISESVIQANAAAFSASRFLIAGKSGPGEAVEPRVAFRDVSWEPLKIVVAICTCSDVLLNAVDLSECIRKIAAMPSVAHVHRFQNLNTPEGWQALKDTLRKSRGNRILLCPCMAHPFAGKIADLGQSIGLHPQLITVLDFRAQAFPGKIQDKKQAGNEILAKIAMGIGKLTAMTPSPVPSVPISASALVVGGGIAGMTAALAIADHGYAVNLVEKSGSLGGNLQQRHRLLDGQSPERLLKDAVSKLENHPKIRIHLNTRILKSSGRMGQFRTLIANENGGDETLAHGISILATGGHEAATRSYEYGKSDRIITQGELEVRLAKEPSMPDRLTTIAMIQCVDSREEPRNYCSRTCCASALKNAIHLKEKNPDLQIFIFYRDLMAYGFMETHYTRARRCGVIFIRYEVDQKPSVVLEDGKPTVTALDPILQRDVSVHADLLVLSTGIVPGASQGLADMFAVRLDQDGFFQEEESKWRPVDLTQRGVFTCGMAHSPRNIVETIAMAEAAALRGLRILTKPMLSAGTSTVASVDENRCTGCRTCVELCAFNAISFSEMTKAAVIDEMLCQGCGVCAAACPVAAISVNNYSPNEMFAQIEGVLVEG